MNVSPFQVKLKEQTAELHSQAEGHPLMQSFINGNYKKEHLLQFLVNMLPIYSVVEQRLLFPLIKDIPGLKRTDLIQHDINFLTTDIINADNVNILTPHQSTCVWVSNMWKKNSSLLKAELYARWLADFYGGRALVKTVSPNFMYSCDNPGGVIGVVRSLLDVAPADEDRLIEEVKNFFTYHVTLFDNIYNGLTN